MHRMRRTKIVATLGPATDDPAVLAELVAGGMDVARLNLSHGNRDDHARRLGELRDAAHAQGRLVAVILDTRGPEVRLGPVGAAPDDSVVLASGAIVHLHCTTDTRGTEGTATDLWVNHPHLWSDVDTADTLLVDDGALELAVTGTGSGWVDARVVRGGALRGGRKLNAPGVHLSLPALSDADRHDLVWGLEEHVDWVAASFVQHAADILAIRHLLEAQHGHMGIIAKIECQAGVENLESILDVADGLMVARGDLGVEFPVERVPVLQKRMLSAARRRGLPSITATQMLESMVTLERPTRAEASDVANAIWDGSDAVMLSEETAIGQHPARAVGVMAQIAEETEAAFDFGSYLRSAVATDGPTVTEAITAAACRVADALHADAIVTPTTSGFSARMVARHRPAAPIVAATPTPAVTRALALFWGVAPVLMEQRADDAATMFDRALNAATQNGLVAAGDLVVLTGGAPVGVPGTTNLLQVRSIGRVVCRGTGIGGAVVVGPIRHLATAADVENIGPGDVVVAVSGDTPGFVAALTRAAGAVVEVGGLTSAAAITALAIPRPIIVGAQGAHTLLEEGAVVTLDLRRGLVYAGTVRVDASST